MRWLLSYFSLHIKTALAYRWNFLIQSTFMMLNNSAFIVFWWFMFQNFSDINGWEMKHIILLFAFAATSYGFASFFFGSWKVVHEIIQEGDADFYLSLPKDPLVHMLVSRSSFSAFGDIVWGVLIIVFFTSANISTLLLYLLYALLGALVWVSIAVIFSSFVFITGRADGFTRITFDMADATTTYPNTVFPFGIKVFFFVIFPAFFISNVPVMLLMTFSWSLFFTFIAVALTLWFIARKLFYLGLRRYESGNLLNVRT